MADTPTRTGWNAAKDDALKTLARDGASLSDAARALQTTKNAVTGRARRLNITFQGSVSRGIREAAARRTSGGEASA